MMHSKNTMILTVSGARLSGEHKHGAVLDTIFDPVIACFFAITDKARQGGGA